MHLMSKRAFAELLATFLLRSLFLRAAGGPDPRKSSPGLRPGRFSLNLPALRPPVPLTAQKVAINQLTHQMQIIQPTVIR